ncbi:MAG TPA: SseB family protein [Candidatus Obscuribacterales bacterium]
MTHDDPVNELESSLLSLMNGKISQADFLRVFLQSRLFIMVNGEPQGSVLGDKQPMVIASAQDAPRLLAVFASPTRAHKMVELFAEYSFPIQVDAEWVLDHIGSHMGIAFNPGCPNGFEMAPEGAQQLKIGLAEARSQSGK